ncbi:hypothetical protein AX16_009799 [Volvariella volvacea WC 439]|nr:hypothetical protein AX16_009799 [Volvariella volvacea WC 439]
MSITHYNQLPSLEKAVAIWKEIPNSTIERLANVFLKPEYYEYGICLVHRHFEIQEEQRMIARATDESPFTIITQPGTDDSYPHTWLVNGQVFEFTKGSKSNSQPEPEGLRKAFRDAVGFEENSLLLWDKTTILGYCYIGPVPPPDRSVAYLLL